MIPEYMQVTRCPWCDAEIDPPAYASTGAAHIPQECGLFAVSLRRMRLFCGGTHPVALCGAGVGLPALEAASAH